MVSLYKHLDEKSVQILKLTIFRQIAMFVLNLHTKQPKNFDEKKIQVLMRHFLDFKNTVALLNTLKA